MKINILWKSTKRIGTLNWASSEEPNMLTFPSELMCSLHAQHVSLEPLPNPASEFTDFDGGIYGVRYFDFYPSDTAGYLISPTSHFVWEKHESRAPDFTNQGAVRGHIGFHAAWPASLTNWSQSYVDHSAYPVKALVKGYGDLVQGTVGWRSERLTIMAVLCEKAKFVDQIRMRYPQINANLGAVANRSKDTSEHGKVEWTPEFQAWLTRTFPPKLNRRQRRQAQEWA